MRKVLITGGSSGIGLAIAKSLANPQSQILIVGRDELRLAAAKEEIEALGAKAAVLSCDLSKGAQAAAQVARWTSGVTDTIDILALNAGFFIEGRMTEFSAENFEMNMDVNFSVNHHLTNALLPLVRRSVVRRIVITGSTAAYEPYPLVPTYGVAKWALRGYALNLRKELMSDSIGVTLISPGATWTRMWEGEDLPENRLLLASDIGKLVSAICSLSPQAVVEELIVRPMLGDFHE